MELICILCPNGCNLIVEGEGENLKISGNKCPKGTSFARAELLHPMRTVTTTVKTILAKPRISVRTSGEIPKDKMLPLMAFLKTVTVTTPQKVGDVIAKNPLDLGVDVIATSGTD